MYFLGASAFVVELIWFILDLSYTVSYVDGFFALNQPALSLLRFTLWFFVFGLLLIRLIIKSGASKTNVKPESLIN